MLVSGFRCGPALRCGPYTANVQCAFFLRELLRVENATSSQFHWLRPKAIGFYDEAVRFHNPTANPTSTTANQSRRDQRSLRELYLKKLNNRPVGQPYRQYAIGTNNEATNPTTAIVIVAHPATRNTHASNGSMSTRLNDSDAMATIKHQIKSRAGMAFNLRIVRCGSRIRLLSRSFSKCWAAP